MKRERNTGNPRASDSVRIPAAITVDPGDPSLLVLAYFVPGSPPEPFPVEEQKPGIIEPTAIYFRRNTRLFYYETLETGHGLDPGRLVQDGNGSASEGTR